MHNSDKNEAINSEQNKPTLNIENKRYSTPEKVSNKLHCRTNSMQFGPDGTGYPMTLDKRIGVNNRPHNINKWQDEFKIAIFSQEASFSHARNYQNKQAKDESYKPFGGLDNPEVIAKLKSKVSLSTDVSSHDEAIKQLIKEKEKPHVITIIEGQRKNLPQKVEVKEQDCTHDYVLAEFWLKGKDSADRDDHRQSMHFYVRKDMIEAINIQSNNIKLPNGDEFTVGEIQFATDKEQYSILVPHIPNKYVRSADQCQKVHNAFVTFATNYNRVVPCYIGDTNYKTPMQPFSNPSVGGNQGMRFLSATSSGAKEHTNFMQAVAIPTQNNNYRVTQPSLLHHLVLALENDETAIDHPSIQTSILLSGIILKRGYVTHQSCDESDDCKLSNKI